VLLKLLDQIALVEEFLEGEIGFVEDCVDGGDVGVTAKSPKHVDGKALGAVAVAIAGLERFWGAKRWKRD
jgi:hypothetical protein